MSSRGIRTLRGAGAGGFAVIVAVVAHAVAGGMPSALSVALALAFGALVGIIGVGGRPSPARTAAVVLVAQAAFHALFVFVVPAGGPAISSHAHGGAQLFTGTLATPGVAVPEGAAMWLAHLAAAVLTVVVVHRADVVTFARLRSDLRVAS